MNNSRFLKSNKKMTAIGQLEKSTKLRTCLMTGLQKKFFEKEKRDEKAKHLANLYQIELERKKVNDMTLEEFKQSSGQERIRLISENPSLGSTNWTDKNGYDSSNTSSVEESEQSE